MKSSQNASLKYRKSRQKNLIHVLNHLGSIFLVWMMMPPLISILSEVARRHDIRKCMLRNRVMWKIMFIYADNLFSIFWSLSSFSLIFFALNAWLWTVTKYNTQFSISSIFQLGLLDNRWNCLVYCFLEIGSLPATNFFFSHSYFPSRNSHRFLYPFCKEWNRLLVERKHLIFYKQLCANRGISEPVRPCHFLSSWKKGSC